MGFTLIDFVEGFHFLKARKRFSAGTQSCYFAILTEFQLAGLPSELQLSTRELKELAGLKSVSATHEARNILKNSKLVDFKTVNGVTVYTLGTEHLPNTYRTLTEHPTEHFAERQGLVCYTPAQVQGGESGSTLPLLPPTPPNNPNPELQPQQSKAKLSNAEQSNAGAEVDIVKVWEELTGKPLTDPANQFMLRRADDMHGREMVKVAIEEHVRCKGKNFSYFEAVLKSLAGRLASLKGGEENGTRVGKQSGANRPSVRTTAAGGTASDYSDTQASGKGRFDDDEPDYSWLYEEIRRIDEERVKATAGSDGDNANVASEDGRTP